MILNTLNWQKQCFQFFTNQQTTQNYGTKVQTSRFQWNYLWTKLDMIYITSHTIRNYPESEFKPKSAVWKTGEVERSKKHANQTMLLLLNTKLDTRKQTSGKTRNIHQMLNIGHHKVRRTRQIQQTKQKGTRRTKEEIEAFKQWQSIRQEQKTVDYLKTRIEVTGTETEIRNYNWHCNSTTAEKIQT